MGFRSTSYFADCVQLRRTDRLAVAALDTGFLVDGLRLLMLAVDCIGRAILLAQGAPIAAFPIDLVVKEAYAS